MFKHILIATDGSELGQKALAQGLELAKLLQAKALAVIVTEPWTVIAGSAPTQSVIEHYKRAVKENAGRIASSVGAAAKTRGITCPTLHVSDKRPADGILEAAKENACDLIVMASHGRRGLGRLLLGSVTTEVLARSPIPVLVCR